MFSISNWYKLVSFLVLREKINKKGGISPLGLQQWGNLQPVRHAGFRRKRITFGQLLLETFEGNAGSL